MKVKFCEDSFWNSQLFNNKNYPIFTECFQYVVLLIPSSLIMPMYFLWLSFGMYKQLPKIHKDKFGERNLMKIIFKVMLLILLILEISLDTLLVKTIGNLDILYVVSFVGLGTSLIIIFAIVETKRRLMHPVCLIQFTFWLSSTFAYLVRFYSNICRLSPSHHYGPIVILCVSGVTMSLFLISLISECFSQFPSTEFELKEGTPCPEAYASIMSKLTFSWLDQYIYKWYKSDMTDRTAFDLNEEDEATRNTLLVEKIFFRKVHKQKERSHTHSIKDPRRILTMSLIRVFLPRLCIAWTFKTVHDILQFTLPFVLKILLRYVKDVNNSPWQGYSLAALFLLIGIVSSVAHNLALYITDNVGIRIRATIIGMIYRKTLNMNDEVRSNFSSGQIVNMMGVDAERVMNFITYSWFMISCPFQICLAMGFLYIELGLSALAVCGILLLVFPLNVLAMKFIQISSEIELTWKDKRVKILSEILNGIKVLKMYAWESFFNRNVTNIREEEVKLIKNVSIGFGIFGLFWDTTPFLVMLTTLLVYIYSDQTHIITVEKTFVSLTLFNFMRLPINIIPWALGLMVNAFVSIERLGRFLTEEDIDMNGIYHLYDSPRCRLPDDVSVKIRKGSFSWKRNSETILKGINMEIKRGKLIAVVGKVGVGKSSLLAAMLGEMVRREGIISIQGSIAYVPQEAWIQNKSLKGNVLFNKDYDEIFYNNVLEACCLSTDLEQFPAGDNTEIGERGINLSGGQKQRVSLARAVYQDRDIYLLDDPLSAVDAHVGHDLFENVISNNGMLRSKTRILVTHSLQWLPRVDEVIVLNSDGCILERGSFQDIIKHGNELRCIIQEYIKENHTRMKDSKNILDVSSLVFQVPNETTPVDDFIKMIPTPPISQEPRKRKQKRTKSKDDPYRRIPLLSEASIFDEFSDDEQTPLITKGSLNRKENPETQRLHEIIEEETIMTGSVSWRTYEWYIAARGMGIFAVNIMIYLVFSALQVYGNVILEKFTSNKDLLNASARIATNSSFTEHYIPIIRRINDHYMMHYGIIGLAQITAIMLFWLGFTIGSVTASRRIHVILLNAILGCPMSFFDTTPSGRTLNRFSKDMDMIDHMVPMNVSDMIRYVCAVWSSVFVIVFVTPYFAIIIAFVLLIYYIIQLIYMPTSRQSRRLDSIASSHIFNHFSETIHGCTVIRAYKEQATFQRLNQSLIDRSSKFKFIQIVSSRWLSFRLDLLSNILVFCAVLFAIINRGNLTVSLIALSVSNALQITASLNFALRKYTELEKNAVAIERIREYSKLPSEETEQSKITPDPDWPSQGNISFVKFKLQYREGLPVVLDGIDLHIEGGQNIGVVGRTGAGKSSLTLALFRLVEPMDGTIFIDGQDIRSLGLHELRRGLNILPQDPMIFSGTLRDNLDPLGIYSERELWESLERVHLMKWMSTQTASLSFECGEGGANLSKGQKQLLCLARAILRKSKVLILDEATASVDVETDHLIMQTIRKEFPDSTVIIIAHRINTILDTDKVVVLEQGRLVEYGRPGELMLNPEGTFKSLLDRTNHKDL